MLEETFSMDKKNIVGRSTLGTNKSSVTDVKNKQDGSQITKFPRTSKRHEPSVAYSRPENKKPNPQTSKALDKRPRTRGYYNERSRNELTEDYLRAEYGSALMQGSKKINLNHLLNFTYTPRESGSSNVPRGLSSSSWKGRNKWGHCKSPFNKELFLQANCQFVVRDSGNYAVHAVDPDTLVDWEFIEQVRIFGHEIPSCPICLYPPSVAKITRCGHIYCWTCILHYLALTDKTWRKCPICYEAVHKKDLKSVMALTTHQYTVGEKISMQLMKKEKGTVFAIPKNQWTERNGQNYRVDENVNTNFVKLLLASSHHSQKIIDDERKALEDQLKEEFNQPEICFTEGALEELKERERILQENQNVYEAYSHLDLLSIKDHPLDISPETVKTNQSDDTKKMVVYSCAFSDEQMPDTCADSFYHDNYHCENNESVLSQNSTQDIAVSNVQTPLIKSEEASIDSPCGSKNTSKTIYYFYQASDGQHIYLNGLNVRCLLQEFKDWENCPDTITANIVELENISITEELRKRLRYLAHLPLTCEVEVAELQLEPPLISLETLQLFHDDIQRRRQSRNKKDREERRWEKRAQVAEKRKMGHYAETSFDYNCFHQYPECSENLLDNCPPLLNSSENSPVVDSPLSTSEFLSVSLPHSEDAQFPSFAQMLRQGKAKPELSKIASPQSQEDTKTPDADTSEPEDYVPVPTYQHSFGDAIQAALKNITHTTLQEDKLQAGQKKKKTKKKLLFSTTMARSK